MGLNTDKKSMSISQYAEDSQYWSSKVMGCKWSAYLFTSCRTKSKINSFSHVAVMLATYQYVIAIAMDGYLSINQLRNVPTHIVIVIDI